MSGQTDNLISLLTPFGLSQEEVKIYLELLEKRLLSALEISRNLHLGRTKVYRLLDKLVLRGLVTQKLESSGFKFVANSPNTLQNLLDIEESRIIGLKKSLTETIRVLEEKIGSHQPGSKVLYYHGLEGLSQVNWNLLQAKGELLTYEVATADAYMPQKEAEKLREGLVKNQIAIKTITNLKSISPFTDVTELIEKWCVIRHISPSVLTIKSDIFIYNNVYTICHYLQKGDIFCIEMHNPQMAQMQKQVFANFWKQSQPLTLIGNHGQMVLN
jgi:sugar-specific transcriptional regulator TrmB